MRTHEQIIKDADGPAALHDKLGYEGRIHTVRSWAQRGSIPRDIWPDLARLQLATIEELALAAPARRPPTRQPEQGRAA